MKQIRDRLKRYTTRNKQAVLLRIGAEATEPIHFNWTFARPSSETFTRAGLP